jgi:hypothetical protein
MKPGDRIRVSGLGPRDSYMREGDNYGLIGSTGTLLELHDNGIASPGYVTCLIELDKPLLNYLVRITLFEAKLERIENGQGINTCESTEV